MSMTKEEAIERFEKQLTAAQAVLDSGFGTNLGESDLLYRRRKEMAEIALSALRPITREQVEKVWRGEWILDEDDGKYQCDNCKVKFPVNYNFCPYCGSAKTEKAMKKVIEKIKRLEGMKNG